jgi:nicotinamidase/pyrazinamidase
MTQTTQNQKSKAQKTALGIIDMQKGFLPLDAAVEANDSEAGYGELPLENGHKLVEVINEVTKKAEQQNLSIFTTQDWHPQETAHFSSTPDFVDSWPVHCVENTIGAELYPLLYVPQTAKKFLKGQEKLIDGKEDTSYSGVNSCIASSDQSFENWVTENEITRLIVIGIALDYCAGKTAIDAANKLGLETYLVEDTSLAIAEQNRAAIIDDLKANGVKICTSNDIDELIAD